MDKFLIFDPRTGQYLSSDGFSFPALWTCHEGMARKFTQEKIDLLKSHWPYIKGCEIEQVDVDYFEQIEEDY